MTQRAAMATRRLAGVLAVASLGGVLEARPVMHWSLEKLAEKNDVLAVAEVLETKQVRAIAAEETRWRCALLEMQARLRVLRVYPERTSTGLKPSEVITIRYSAIDWSKGAGVPPNGPQFPELHQDEVYVFPLRKADREGEDRLALLAEEDVNLLVPAARAALPETDIVMDIEFLQRELAGAFARGRYADIFRAAKYLRGVHDATGIQPVFRLVAKHVGDDEPRWLDIAVATYCALPLQRPTIAELRAEPERQRPAQRFVALALRRVRDDGLDDRIIARALDRVALHPWGTGVTLQKNYPRHPATLSLLTQVLAKDVPEAVYVAGMLVRDAEHPLLPAALPAAKRRVLKQGPVGMHTIGGFGTFRAACELIRDYGSDDDFAVLVAELRRAQKADRGRFLALWQATAYSDSGRLLPLCRIAITDTAILSPGARFCDVAAFEAQRIIGQDFGLAPNQPREERDQAIAKVKAWLDANTP